MVVKKDIRSLSIDQLKEILEENSFQSFRAKQIYHWSWKKSSHDFSSMHNLPNKLLTFLENNFVIRNIEISKQQKSKDGTIKMVDADVFEEILTLRGHHGDVWGLAISHIGDYLVSVSGDRSLRVWQRTSEQVFLEEEKDSDSGF